MNSPTMNLVKDWLTTQERKRGVFNKADAVVQMTMGLLVGLASDNPDLAQPEPEATIKPTARSKTNTQPTPQPEVMEAPKGSWPYPIRGLVGA